jgi:wyosine [tRNA(Phe)-imidazoG37] synthetase (radical SAM superfamily)
MPIKSVYIYGPVRSRRIGTSLGINILGTQHKLCNFNCQYCQYGLYVPVTSAAGYEAELPAPELIEAELSSALLSMVHPPDYLTLSGNGEPTLHHAFPEMVEVVRQCRDRYAPNARTALLTNATRAANPAVRKALEHVDLPVMKLDAGTEVMLRQINDPAMGITLDRIVTSLRQCPNAVLQSLFAGGKLGNHSIENLEAWIGAVKYIKPKIVQIYTLRNPLPERQLERLGHQELEAIQCRLCEEGIESRVY